jgi:hypothetical protein
MEPLHGEHQSAPEPQPTTDPSRNPKSRRLRARAESEVGHRVLRSSSTVGSKRLWADSASVSFFDAANAFSICSKAVHHHRQ